ncbi:LRR receptor-like kinase family protein [Quillaja saponaria]|uniref:LRR receptor-like kinase family protein n=1 Tax=Quillaja saponaria TaxID=32244 RepID=A0AAD7Q3R8_QUISA|nr:LRR receptor-like kinase family protein [Quillaja saponaria]
MVFSYTSVIKWHFFHKLMSPILVVKLFFLLWALSMSQIDVVLADSDKSVLLQFKNSVSDPSGLLSSWDSVDSNHCHWFGVSCDSNSRVFSLNITGNGGEGKSNASSCSNFAHSPLYLYEVRRSCEYSRGKLIGKVSPVISKLSELRILSLPFNGLDGEVPNEIWGMDKLEVLDLEGNSITGSLPIQFGGFRNLRVLNLGFNRIVGEIPSSLTHLASLEILNLAGNTLNGSLPGFLGQLREVYLLFNLFTGPISSEIGENCRKLEHLDLSGNFLVGKIPRSLGNCTQLRKLLLYSNMLEEDIPSELGYLQKLEILDVSRNSLSGSIPPELGKCSELYVLVLSNLFNPLPEGNNTKRDSLLGQLNDELNYFEGALPEEITTLPKLRILWAPRATLEGRFSRNWGACDNLEMINLAQNYFTGKFTDELSHCKNLFFLDLSSNSLSGELLEELPVPCMTVFDVSGNLLSGSIPKFSNRACPTVPSWKGDLYGPNDILLQYQSFFASKSYGKSPLISLGEDGNLSVLHNFGHNNFTGIIQSMPISPARLGKQTVYTFLVGENKLTGPFPGNLFEKCEGLDSLLVNVSNNRLSSPIPVNIGTMCRSLKFLDASGNQITGKIPPGLGGLVSLVSLNLSKNLLQGQIPTTLGQIKDLKFLSLAGNSLTGVIPSSLGQLYSLKVLDLSSNSLTGEIPKVLVNLRSLEGLLLKYNKLSGQIPAGLANVATLSMFNVSFNNLSGSLPLNSNLMKCSSAVGNPYIQSCRMFSLTVPSSDQQGRVGYSNSYAASPSGATSKRRGSGFNSIEIASITSASAIVSVLLALIVLFFYTRKWNPRSRVLGATRKEVTVFTDIGVPLTFENVVHATGSFNASNCIGNGGFGDNLQGRDIPGSLGGNKTACSWTIPRDPTIPCRD